jgi:hypothetical protein
MVFARFGRPLLNSAVDTITNPQTYIRLGNEASEVLGRTLPQRFQGAGFQNLPAQFTGALDALSGMAPGAAKETARNKLKQSLQQAARAQEPGLVRPFGQTAEGALRAPNIGAAPLRAPAMNAPASTTLPQAGGPLARDYALGRSSGATKEMGAIRKLLEQTPAQATSLLGKLNPLNNAGRILNPTSFRGGILYGTAAETLLPRLGLDQKNTSAISTALTMPGGPAVKALAGLIAYDVNNPVADGTLQAAPKLNAEQIKKANKIRAEQGLPPLSSTGEVVSNSQQRPQQEPVVEPRHTIIHPPLEEMDPNAPLPNIVLPTNTSTAQVPPGLPVRDDRTTPNLNPVTTENGQVTTPINLPAPLPDPQLASTPAQNAGAMDPYAYQLAVYGQGRQALASQNADAAVRDLGLSIHQRLYPQFYADKNNIPTTQEQVPNAMTVKDSQYELGAATQAVEELLDPSILEQLNAMNLRRTGY